MKLTYNTYVFSILLSLFFLNSKTNSENCEPCKPKKEWCRLNAPRPKVDISGYVQFYPYWDTRQVFGFRDGHFLMYPLQYLPDVNGKDINSRGQYYISPIQSRLKFAGSGVDVFDARAIAVIEFDFFGTFDAVSECSRLRYAFITLDWEEEQISLLLGQYWHPLAPEDQFPRTIDFNGGAPIAIALRSPQAKLTKRWCDTEFMVALTAEHDNPSNGPKDPSPIYSRNSLTPGIDSHIRQYFGDNLIAAAVAYKRLTPQLSTINNYKTTESTYGLVAMGYTRFIHNEFTLNSTIAYMENANNPYFFGGYAVATRNSMTGCETYTPIKDVAWWVDMLYKNRCLTGGLFAGVIKDLGSKKPLFENPDTNKPILYMLPTSDNIDYVWRVAPRVIWDAKPMQFCFELEITGAAYGATRDFQTGKVLNARNVTDCRFLAAIYYYF